MWSTVAVNTKDKYSISGQCRDRFPCYPMFDNSRATEMIFFTFSTLFLFPKNSNRQNRSDLCLVNDDLHWLKFLISVVERPDNGFRIHHHHVFIPFWLRQIFGQSDVS